MHCNQQGCNQPAAHRFTWPGRDEAGICAIHAPKLRDTAGVLGLYLQLLPLLDRQAAPDGGEGTDG